MSSWHYAFLFPTAGAKMSPGDAVSCLTIRGLECDGRIRLCVPIDKEGHLLDVGEEVALTNPFIDDVKCRLLQGEDFSIQLRNSETFLSCFFAMQAANPHVSFGWSKRLFRELPATVRNQYWTMIRDFAAHCKAGYVVVVDDASDQFEDRFIEMDGKRFLDTSIGHSYGHGIQEVWFNEACGAKPPEGVCLTDFLDIGHGFYQCRVA